MRDLAICERIILRLHRDVGLLAPGVRIQFGRQADVDRGPASWRAQHRGIRASDSMLPCPEAMASTGATRALAPGSVTDDTSGDHVGARLAPTARATTAAPIRAVLSGRAGEPSIHATGAA